MPTANLRVDFPPLPRRSPSSADRSLASRAHHHRSSRAVDTSIASAPMIAPMRRRLHVICNRTRNIRWLSSRERSSVGSVENNETIGSRSVRRIARSENGGARRSKKTHEGRARSAALRIPLRRGAIVTPACKRQRVPPPPRKRKGTATRNETLPVRRTSGPTV